MEEDEFNDFQHPVSQQPSKPHQPPAQSEPQIKEEGDLFAHNFFNFDAKNVNPSSSLATMTFQQLSENIENKDFEDSISPHLNKIHSQNLPTLEPHLITFQKSHSQSEHKIDLFDYSSALFHQNKTHTQQDVTPSIVPQQLGNINLIENSNVNPISSLNPSVENQAVAFSTIQNDFIGFENDLFVTEKPIQQQQLREQEPASSNKQISSQPQDNFLRFEGQANNLRKQSEQFVFSQPVQPTFNDANNIAERKESEEFVFGTEHIHQQTLVIQNKRIPQFLNSVPEQQPENIGKKEQDKFIYTLTENHLSLTSTQQQNTILDPNVDAVLPKNTLELQEEDQFGDFEETVHNNFTQANMAKQEAEMKVQNHPSIVQLYEQQAPFGVNPLAKRKELQQLIDSLPNYSTLFIMAVQSL